MKIENCLTPLLVFIIIVVLLVVIVPRAMFDRKQFEYSLVRQNASELAAFATMWAEKSIQAQDEQLSTATIADYFATLAGADATPASGAAPGQWIADQGPNNWNLVDGTNRNNTVVVTGRYVDGNPDVAPEECVEEVVPADKIIKNSFNDVNVFREPNFPTTDPITGALALGGFREVNGKFMYYAFCFQGKDNTKSTNLNSEASFHTGSELHTFEGLKNGIFLGRVRCDTN